MKKYYYFIPVILLITLFTNCKGKNTKIVTLKNKEIIMIENIWNKYLKALKTGDEKKIKSVSINGYQFTKNWLDSSNYKRMCISLGYDWSKSKIKINITNDFTAIGYFKVKLLSKSFFMFGPGILVGFKKVNEEWEIEYISFSGD